MVKKYTKNLSLSDKFVQLSDFKLDHEGGQLTWCHWLSELVPGSLFPKSVTLLVMSYFGV